jgi:CelD/BcsL family acetyltransferase involved in cellulose biosynthesis
MPRNRRRCRDRRRRCHLSWKWLQRGKIPHTIRIPCIFPDLLRLPLTVSKKHVQNRVRPQFTFTRKRGTKTIPRKFTHNPTPLRVEGAAACHDNELPRNVKGSGKFAAILSLILIMSGVAEINRIEQLAQFRQAWGELLRQTAGASFFQSLEWLEVYWRHFGRQKKLRVLLVSEDGRLAGILPLVVEREKSKVGPLRVLTFPLHAWGSFYGPIGPDPQQTLTAGLEHIQRTPRDWDFLELRGLGAPATDAQQTRQAMSVNGFQGYLTEFDRTVVVDVDGTWESYCSTWKKAWLRQFHRAERALAAQGDLSYVRYRPAGTACEQDSPRWDLYDACEEIARRSWQGSAAKGTTLSHEAVRSFLREMHEAAVAAGAVDLNLLSIDGAPVAFIYGYFYGGYVYGLRRGFDFQRARKGAGTVLMAYALRDSFARGDRIYDLGVGSLASKRYLQTRQISILRCSHYPPTLLRTQVLRLKRWWQSRQLPTFIAAGRVENGTADAR